MTGSASFACDGVAGPDIAVLRFRAESRCGQRGSEHHSILYLAYRHTSLGCMGFCPVALLIEGAVPSPVSTGMLVKAHRRPQEKRCEQNLLM